MDEKKVRVFDYLRINGIGYNKEVVKKIVLKKI